MYGSDDLGELFQKNPVAFWGEKPKSKRLVPRWFQGKEEDEKQQQQRSQSPGKKKATNQFYLAFYSDSGCQQVTTKSTLEVRQSQRNKKAVRKQNDKKFIYLEKVSMEQIKKSQSKL